MSKELEALEIIGKLYLINDEQVKDWDKRDFNILKSALQRLEQIDNANPSEALECLERIDNTLCLNNIKGKLEFGIDTEEHTDCDSVIGMTEDLETIKQALLKAEKEHNSVNLLMQELDCKDFADLRKYARCGYEKLNKKYLKWEDLEFDVPTTKKVKMGDTQYLLSLRISLSDVKSVVLRDNNLKPYLHLFEKEKQFFNDLHLERVEE